MEKEITNKVSESGLVQINLEEVFPVGERVLLDIKPWLFEELILKEKDFRLHLKQHDWMSYKNKFVAVTCTADAIVPTWAYMLVAMQLQPFAAGIVFGDLKKLNEELLLKQVEKINPLDYKDQRVVIRGCSTEEVPVSVYMMLAGLLQPVAKSIMYGEPCSTVPLYKRKE